MKEEIKDSNVIFNLFILAAIVALGVLIYQAVFPSPIVWECDKSYEIFLQHMHPETIYKCVEGEWDVDNTATYGTEDIDMIMAIQAKREKADNENKIEEKQKFCGKDNVEVVKYLGRGSYIGCKDYSLVPDENIKLNK